MKKRVHCAFVSVNGFVAFNYGTDPVMHSECNPSGSHVSIYNVEVECGDDGIVLPAEAERVCKIAREVYGLSETGIKDDAGNVLILKFGPGEFISLVIAGEQVGNFGQRQPLETPVVIKGTSYRWLYRGSWRGAGSLVLGGGADSCSEPRKCVGNYE